MNPNKILSDKLYQNIDFVNIAFIITIIMLSCIIFYYNTLDIKLKIAYQGHSPHEYVSQKLYPKNFERNWESGIKRFDYSLCMRVYYYMAKYFGISPTKSMYPFMFIQTLFFLLSIGFLTQTLFQNKFVTFLSVVVISVSNLAGLNLSRYGVGYSSALGGCLHYTYANAFRIFGFGFFLRNKYIPCFIFLALSVFCNVHMGLFAGVFIGAYMIYKPGLFRDKSVLIGISVFIALVAPHIYSIISNASISSGGIPVDQWVKSTRIFSCHWYPFTMKLFTRNAKLEFFPFLLLCFFFFTALKYQDVKSEKNLKIIVGFIACLIMGMLGVVFSDVYPIPFLIKISLQRSTGLITFFGVLYIIYYLFKKAENGKIFNIFLAIYSLLIFVFSKPGIAILPLFLLSYSDIKDGHFGLIKISSNKTKIAKYIYYSTAILLLLLTLTSIVKYDLKTSSLFPIANSIFVHLWAPLQYFSPFYGFHFLLRGGSFKVYPIFTYLLIGTVLITCAIMTLRVAKNKAVTILFISIFFLMSLSIVWYLERDQYLRWHNRYAKVAESYLDAQLWAKKNTPTDALFMPDPSHSYGWRDFSERSSFGNLREWGYCAIAYNPDYKTYKEGIKRMKEFGIDIGNVTADEIKKYKGRVYGSKLSRRIQKKYYRLKAKRLKDLAAKFGIDYIIMNKKFHKKRFNMFKIAYENCYYIVYKAG